MQSLVRAVSRPQAGGAPLPTIFPSLGRQRADVRRGEVTLIGAEPGVGKTALALWMAEKWVHAHGLRGLYFSADSSELVVAARLVAMTEGVTWTDAERRILNGDAYINSVLEGLNPLRFCFDPDISLLSIEQEVEAFVELWGDTPDFIVIDNLTDVDGQNEDEFGGLRRIMKVMKYLARESGAAVIVLHHTSEGATSDPCPPRKAFHGKTSQKAAVALTIGAGFNQRYVAVVKNRYGQSDRSGQTYHTLSFDGTTMQFADLQGVAA